MTLDSLQEQKRLVRLKQDRISWIDKTFPRNGYPLKRGEQFEQLVVDCNEFYGVESDRYRQKFTDFPNPAVGCLKHLLQTFQKDIYVVGGTSGKRYDIEVKSRQNVFDYPTVYIGKIENWDLKTATATVRKGYKEPIAMVIVDDRSGEMRVCLADAEARKGWTVAHVYQKRTKKTEVCYQVPTEMLYSFAEFASYIKSL